ncbi:Peptidase inhibitor family I36 [Lentzea xinjiangensis]|uniref:Peptidase inhibitor family I36 n=1 Tax=Lentzea xinjiangensis TaxID=402600 RepID=A0A1H9AG79_9PSEU|nr:peptidase inhibitor family I36 protein [Lentzea xinjiangensis]SEP75595.1 Peptidase inhibitor family I36 [Lentzea xinjiangensis]
MNNSSKKVIRTAFAGALAAVFVAVAAPAASAAARDGVCNDNEFCLYHFSNRIGSISDFTGNIPNYGDSQPTCYEFKKPSAAGYLECVKNNAASVCNYFDRDIRVYFNSNYEGTYDTVRANTCGNLVNTYYENASHRFI